MLLPLLSAAQSRPAVPVIEQDLDAQLAQLESKDRYQARQAAATLARRAEALHDVIFAQDSDAQLWQRILATCKSLADAQTEYPEIRALAIQTYVTAASATGLADADAALLSWQTDDQPAVRRMAVQMSVTVSPGTFAEEKDPLVLAAVAQKQCPPNQTLLREFARNETLAAKHRWPILLCTLDKATRNKAAAEVAQGVGLAAVVRRYSKASHEP